MFKVINHECAWGVDLVEGSWVIGGEGGRQPELQIMDVHIMRLACR
jgi:hypothetical protein